MNLPKITIHTFVYDGDAAIIKETVLCAMQALPEARVVVVDDANSPCPPEIREEIEELGAEWRTTEWSRGGNLRGKTCITGILSELYSSAESDDDVLIKIDADTCLMNGDEIRVFAADREKILCSSGSMDVRIYGCCYCIRAHAVKKTLGYIETLEISDMAAEDVIIGLSIFHLFPDPSLHILTPTDQKGTKWTAYHWGYYPDARMYHGATIITVGNKAPAPLTKKQRLPVMKALRMQAAAYIHDLKNRKQQAG